MFHPGGKERTSFYKILEEIISNESYLKGNKRKKKKEKKKERHALSRASIAAIIAFQSLSWFFHVSSLSLSFFLSFTFSVFFPLWTIFHEKYKQAARRIVPRSLKIPLISFIILLTGSYSRFMATRRYR